MNEKRTVLLKALPKLLLALTACAGLLLYPKQAAGGVHDGLILLSQTVIPSLFPFLVLSTYLSAGEAGELFSRLFGGITKVLFRLNKSAAPAVLMGLLGGYPVGAKTVAELYSAGKLSHNEAERLMYFNINAGPAFVVTAVGVSMLDSALSGGLLLLSLILSSLTLGVVCRFLSDGSEKRVQTETAAVPKQYLFVSSVESGARSMISISAWVLTFSCIGAFTSLLPADAYTGLLLKCIFEVTTGCRYAAGTVPLPVIAAILGFGGLCVACQVLPYLDVCDVKLERFFAARVTMAALSALYSSVLLRIFPRCAPASTAVGVGPLHFTVSLSVPASIILLLMCVILILEVDNRKKVC